MRQLCTLQTGNPVEKTTMSLPTIGSLTDIHFISKGTFKSKEKKTIKISDLSTFSPYLCSNI